jgi:hypothetical protein
MKSVLICLAIWWAFFTQGPFQPYPGSKLDGQSGCRETARSKNLGCKVYTTRDSFEVVYAFYKARYKEFPIPLPAQRLPNDREVKWAFFILDGAKDLSQSEHWMKIQRPFIGTIAEGARVDFKDIRDVSVIQTVDKH